jgi:CHAT domain-containing protein
MRTDDHIWEHRGRSDALWCVDDRATSLVMGRFYETWLVAGGGTSKADALAEAKRWLRSHRGSRGRRPSSDPYYWVRSSSSAIPPERSA